MDSADSTAKQQQAVAEEDDGGHREPLRLAQAYTACSDLYVEILNGLRGQQVLSQPTFISLERTYSYFLLWANGYGVVDGSIEASLDKSKRARQATFRLLISISRTLTKKLLPALKKETQAKLSAEASKLTQATNQLRSRMIQVRLGNNSSGSDSDSDADSIGEVEDLLDIAEDLRTDTQCLLDLGARFDEPALGGGAKFNVDQDAVLAQPVCSLDTLKDPVLDVLHQSAVPASMPLPPSHQAAEEREWRMDKNDTDCLKDLQRTYPCDDKKQTQDSKGDLLQDTTKQVPEDHDSRQWQKDVQNQLLWTVGPVPPKADDTVDSQLHSQASPSPSHDTKGRSRGFTQTLELDAPYSKEVKDEVEEGVWGYLFPLTTAHHGQCLVLKRRGASPLSDTVEDTVSDSKGKSVLQKEEPQLEKTKARGVSSSSYLIGRRPECDIVVRDSSVSNHHCLLFMAKNKSQDTVAVIQDLSSNGTFLNEAIIGRNQRKELKEGDEIAVFDKAHFIFRYPRSRQTTPFLQQYTLLEPLGKGYFAEVFSCVEKANGKRYAVKIFSNTSKLEEYSKTKDLQQEIAVPMGVSHPNLLCVKDTFAVGGTLLIVMELAKSDLFNRIVQNRKMTENETRNLFIQLFQGIKYLHDREIIHRHIKLEKIRMVDDSLHAKLADFGLAKIFNQEHDVPSYMAPEMLIQKKDRKYTKAVDVWSLGVVMYICLCGFTPFSDELYSKDFPFTLSQQVRAGKFDYPSPYWDSVGESAIDLIDSMLVVDPEKRFTVDQCLAHPWMTASVASVHDSTDGLAGGFVAGLDVHRRGVVRERTLLADINSVRVTEVAGAEVQKIPHTAPEPRLFRQQKSGGGPAMGGEVDQENSANYEPASPASPASPESLDMMPGGSALP